jgi:hypothetical protein
MTITEAKLVSMQIRFNQIEVLNRRADDREIVAFRSQQQLNQLDISLLAQNFKLNLNHEVVMRLVKTYYKLFPKQVTLRS